jgi:hypothetical protein|tara:strand:+ start:60 stop:737 length:678 start_codon:yes stop_codon:yes gene_type:complete
MASRSSRKRARTDSLAQEPSNEIVQLKETLGPQAQLIVFQQWPQKIIELTALIEELQTTAYQTSPPVLDTTDQYAIHPQVKQVLDSVKKQVIALVEDLSVLITWVRFNRPKLEAGANFGVSVQHDVLSNLASGRNSAVSVYQSITNYYFTRGRVLRRVQKNMGLEDYNKACTSLDAKQYAESAQIVADLRSIYLMLADKLFKNWKYVEKPKGSKTERKARSEFYM